MEREGSADTVFYDGIINSRRAFLRFIKGYRCYLVRVEEFSGVIAGVFWLNEFIGKSAMLHFCTFGNDVGAKERLCTQAMQWVSDKKVLDSLYGLTPKPYRHIWQLMRAIGCTKRGSLPGACHLKYHDRYVDGIISVIDLRNYDLGRA